ncbi:MAG: tRNA threonylcarbamoyl adenosine modification protein (Sua5/YciO/YrdC/YwlC family) [Patiriisocius sp.]|jgi:tRNA threonylcarbamoyl adenosine modification protein (Sua5/YciO/YrdC/YwlC family)
MILKVYEQNPNVDKAVKVLRDGGIVIFPTDTIYAIGCDSTNSKALEKLAKIKGVKLQKSNFSLLCADLSHLSKYTSPINNSIFKLMKKVLPGPFTFILPAGRDIPNLFLRKKKTVGIRVPDNSIVNKLILELGKPLVSTSVHDDDEVLEYTTDPELIHEKYEHQVQMVIDGGYGQNVPSTVLDCTSSEPVLVRQGAGVLA